MCDPQPPRLIFNNPDFNTKCSYLQATYCKKKRNPPRSDLFRSGLTVNLSDTNTFGLLTLSNQFLISGLESVCQAFIIDNPKLFDPFHALVLGQKLNLKEMQLFFEWFLTVHYSEYFNHGGWEKIPVIVKDEISGKWWPGPKYQTKREKWEQKLAATEKEQAKHKQNCVLQ